jgi:hypothetical protein
MLDTWIIHNLIRVQLGTSTLQEGAVVADGEWSQQPGKEKPTGGNTKPEKRRRCKHSPHKKRYGDTSLGYSGQTALRREQYNVDGQSISR